MLQSLLFSFIKVWKWPVDSLLQLSDLEEERQTTYGLRKRVEWKSWGERRDEE